MPIPSLNIFIDASKASFIEISDELAEKIEENLDEVTEEIEWSWRKHASKKLKESKEEYLKSLKITRSGNTIQAELSSPLAVHVEVGSNYFDLKPGFLKTRLSRIIPMKNPLRFRTVSLGKRGWKHPGIRAREIHKDVMYDFENEILPQAMDKLMANLKI